MAAVTKSTCTGVERPVFWQDGKLVMIDQRDLPGAFTLFSVDTVDATIKAIKDMAVRGAPAIGAAGAFGLALAANASPAKTACVAASGGGGGAASRARRWASRRAASPRDWLSTRRAKGVAAPRRPRRSRRLTVACQSVRCPLPSPPSSSAAARSWWRT